MGKLSTRFEPAVIMCRNVYYDNIDNKYYCCKHTDGFKKATKCHACGLFTLEHGFEYTRKDK